MVGTTNIVENPVVHVSINFMKSIITNSMSLKSFYMANSYVSDGDRSFF